MQQSSVKPHYRLFIILIVAIGAFTFRVLPTEQQQVAEAASNNGLNPIQMENMLPGTANWQIGHPSPQDTNNYTNDQGIEGYSSETSVGPGSNIGFAVNTITSSFNADI
jgi:hypothetical protein